MLTEMLRLLNGGGLHALDQVARALGVSEALAGEMADGLARRGYLAPLQPPCSSECDGCAAATACGLPDRPRARLLMLTDKGRRAAAG